MVLTVKQNFELIEKAENGELMTGLTTDHEVGFE
jgi:hypothetical protein